MAAKLTFQTLAGPGQDTVHAMRIMDGRTPMTQGQIYQLFRTRPVAEYLSWVGPAYLAANGKAYRIGRNLNKVAVAWKSIKISKRYNQDSARYRSVPGGYKGDFSKSWTRDFNGRKVDFTRVAWNGGQEGFTVTAREHNKTTVLHEFHYYAK